MNKNKERIKDRNPWNKGMNRNRNRNKIRT